MILHVTGAWNDEAVLQRTKRQKSWGFWTFRAFPLKREREGAHTAPLVSHLEEPYETVTKKRGVANGSQAAIDARGTSTGRGFRGGRLPGGPEGRGGVGRRGWARWAGGEWPCRGRVVGWVPARADGAQRARWWPTGGIYGPCGGRGSEPPGVIRRFPSRGDVSGSRGLRGGLSPWRGGRVGDGDAQGATVAGRTSGGGADLRRRRNGSRWKTRRASAGGAGDSARAGGAMPDQPECCRR